MHIRNGLLESDNDLQVVIRYNYPRSQDEYLITAPPNSSCIGDTVSGILGNCFPRQLHLAIPVSLWRHRTTDFWLDSFSYVRVSLVNTTLWRWWVLNYFDFSIFICLNRRVNRTKRQTVPPEPRAKRLSLEILGDSFGRQRHHFRYCTNTIFWSIHRVFQSLVIPEKFQHILRILSTNIDGKRKVMFAMTAIKGIGRRFSNIVLKKADVDLNKRAGECTDEEVCVQLITINERSPVILPACLLIVIITTRTICKRYWEYFVDHFCNVVRLYVC